MYSWVKFSHLVEWTKGRSIQPTAADFTISAFSTDSRSVKHGDVFVALKGENFDGHAYVEEVAKKGAAAVITERPYEIGIPCLVVPNTLNALVQVGQALRAAFKGPVVAITGSAGKSSTKEIASVLLGPRTLASPASFNNLLGVSKTLCLIQDSTEKVVLEMGMNNFGEIAELCRVFRPNYGLITNIGDAHIGKLGGKEGIYRAKKELFDFLAGQGAQTLGVGLNLDDELVDKAYRAAFAASTPRTLTYGESKVQAQVRLRARDMDPETAFLHVVVEMEGKKLEARLPIFGTYHALNILAGLTVAQLLNVSLDDISARLNQLRPASHRGQIHVLRSGATLIDESYNSNPTAATSSVESVAFMNPARRRLLVLGEMRELGEFSEKMHRELGEAVARSLGQSPGCVIGVSAETKHLLAAAKAIAPALETHWVATADEALVLTKKLLRATDICLVKGSRGIRLEKVVEGLLA